MKKILIIILVSLLMNASSLTYAQDKTESMNKKGMMDNTGMMGSQGMRGRKAMMMDKDKMQGMHPMGGMMMKGMMMKGMMEKSMDATGDGGIVVLAGNRLMKYDKNLKLIKEVDIKIDMEAMQKNMTEMMKNCPKMQGDMADEDKTNMQPSEMTSSMESGKN